MKLAVVQMNPVFGEKEKNLEKVCNYIDKSKSDIIVLPELCTTGYFFLSREEVAKYAEPYYGETISLIEKKARDQNRIIIFGFAEKDNGGLFNSAAVLFPDSSLNRIYRKTHLFYREHYCFDPGDSGFFVIHDKQRDIKIGTMICYDWRFPEAARSLGVQGADIIACPSNLVTDVWHLAMPARALENKVYLAIANRSGKETRNDEELFFKGESAIYNYNGIIKAKATFETEEIIYSDIFPERTRNKSFNEFNNIFSDRRPDMYIS